MLLALFVKFLTDGDSLGANRLDGTKYTVKLLILSVQYYYLSIASVILNKKLHFTWYGRAWDDGLSMALSLAPWAY